MAAGLSYDEQLSGPLETWLEFTLGATDVGGIRATPWQWYHDIQFHAWWNNARDAVGLYWWGRRLNPEWVRRAKFIVELALTAPQEQGTFRPSSGMVKIVGFVDIIGLADHTTHKFYPNTGATGLLSVHENPSTAAMVRLRNVLYSVRLNLRDYSIRYRGNGRGVHSQ